MSNPYQSPRSDSQTVRPSFETSSVIAIKGLIRAWKMAGWFLVILSSLELFLVAAIGFWVRYGPTPPKRPELVFSQWIVVFFLLLGFLMLLHANQIQKRERNVQTRALQVSWIMLIGFPLLTALGIYSIQTIRKHYRAYLLDSEYADRERASQEPW